jgi:hypothetical protein
MSFADAETLISVEMNNHILLRYITLQWCIMFPNNNNHPQCWNSDRNVCQLWGHPHYSTTSSAPFSAPHLSNIIGDPRRRTRNLQCTTYQHYGANKPTGSSASCSTTSHSTGPSPAGAKATHATSLDSRLHRTDSLACSHSGPLRASPDNWLPRVDSFAYSLAGSPRLSGQQAPMVDSLAYSLARSLHNSGQPAVQDGLTSRQLHRIALRTFADQLPRHPNTSSRLPMTLCS